MSNITVSKRKPTKIDFFDKAIDLRKKIVEYIVIDFSDNDFIKRKIRDDIYRALQDMMYCLTQANTIYITNLYEYNERRRYMTRAIGDCEYVIQEMQFAIRSYEVKASKYEKVIEDILSVENSIKNWRKSDNGVRNRLKG